MQGQTPGRRNIALVQSTGWTWAPKAGMTITRSAADGKRLPGSREGDHHLFHEHARGLIEPLVPLPGSEQPKVLLPILFPLPLAADLVGPDAQAAGVYTAVVVEQDHHFARGQTERQG